MSKDHEVNEVIRKLRRCGCVVDCTRRKKIKIILPNGRFYFMPRTPSCRRWMYNLSADLKRMDERVQL